MRTFPFWPGFKFVLRSNRCRPSPRRRLLQPYIRMNTYVAIGDSGTARQIVRSGKHLILASSVRLAKREPDEEPIRMTSIQRADGALSFPNRQSQSFALPSRRQTNARHGN